MPATLVGFIYAVSLLVGPALAPAIAWQMYIVACMSAGHFLP